MRNLTGLQLDPDQNRTLLFLVGVTGSRWSLLMLTTFSDSCMNTEHIPPCRHNTMQRAGQGGVTQDAVYGSLLKVVHRVTGECDTQVGQETLGPFSLNIWFIRVLSLRAAECCVTV